MSRYALGTWAGSAAVIYDNASPRATAGYFSDPRTGVITQWGFVTSGAGTSGSVTFPKEFVSNCRAVLTTSTEASTPCRGLQLLNDRVQLGERPGKRQLLLGCLRNLICRISASPPTKV